MCVPRPAALWVAGRNRWSTAGESCQPCYPGCRLRRAPSQQPGRCLPACLRPFSHSYVTRLISQSCGTAHTAEPFRDIALLRRRPQVKAAREARNSAGSRSHATNSVAEATAVAAAAASDANARRSAPRRNSSLRRMHATSASTPAAAEAVTASCNHLTTPTTSNEQQQQPQQHLTSSTHLNTDSSSQPLGLSRSEKLLSSSEAVATAADAAGPSSRGAAGLTGWLQIVPVHQQQHGVAVSADCASTMHPDIRSRDGQQGTSGSGSGGSGASAGQGAQQNQLAHCNSAGGLSDASRQPWEAAGKALPCSQQPQQHAAPADKQQQLAGNLRRHLLSGWRNKRRGSTDNSSMLDSPTAAAAAAAPAGTAASHDGRSSERISGHRSGTSAAAAAAVVSSGGTVAIMHAPEASGSNGNRGSGGGSQPSWAGTGGSSARRLEDEEGRKEQAEQQVCGCVWVGVLG